MDEEHLKKLIRITGVVRELSAAAVKAGASEAISNREKYKTYYDLIIPVIGSNLKYQLEFQAIPKPESTNMHNIGTSFINFRAFLDEVIKGETLESKIQVEEFKKAFFLEANKPFSAYKIISELLTKSVTDLWMVDNYLESTSLDFFNSVNSQVGIKIITMRLLPRDGDFKTALNKFISEWGGTKFEVKKSNYFHDRYIIIDQTEVWHLGPSLNHLGVKPFMISQIQDQEIIKAIIDSFSAQWVISTDI